MPQKRKAAKKEPPYAARHFNVVAMGQVERQDTAFPNKTNTGPQKKTNQKRSAKKTRSKK
jgi:hypothetical protein